MTENSETIVRGHCPQCGPDRKAHVRGKATVRWDDANSPVHGSTTGFLLECCGCETLYFRRDLWFSEWDDGDEDITYFPFPAARKKPSWVEDIEVADAVLGRLLGELYLSLDAGLRVMSATAIRTAIDRASELLGVNPSLKFFQKLDGLETGGHISSNERKILDVLIDAGSAAAHRGWRPTPDQLSIMMDALEGFLHRALILGDVVKSLQAAVSSKP